MTRPAGAGDDGPLLGAVDLLLSHDSPCLRLRGRLHLPDLRLYTAQHVTPLGKRALDAVLLGGDLAQQFGGRGLVGHEVGAFVGDRLLELPHRRDDVDVVLAQLVHEVQLSCEVLEAARPEDDVQQIDRLLLVQGDRAVRKVAIGDRQVVARQLQLLGVLPHLGAQRVQLRVGLIVLFDDLLEARVQLGHLAADLLGTRLLVGDGGGMGRCRDNDQQQPSSDEYEHMGESASRHGAGLLAGGVRNERKP